MDKNKTESGNLLKVKSIDIRSSEYPLLLKEIKDPPKKIYYRGIWNPDIFKETLSAVGSRRMTGYGEIITERLISETAAAGITTVSGFMYGIDAVSHDAALAAGGITAAVMPCGIERVHPAYQEKLYSRILRRRGLVISEYEGDMKPARWTFPRRNRIIAALSPALLVVEAGIKSGALITADYAQKYSRHIFAVPGPLTSRVSLGTAGLIKQGASIVTGAGDILNFYGRFSLVSSSGSDASDKYSSVDSPPADICRHSTAGKIILLLSEKPLYIDEITRKISEPANKTGSEVTKLVLGKIIKEKKGLYYLISGGNRF